MPFHAVCFAFSFVHFSFDHRRQGPLVEGCGARVFVDASLFAFLARPPYFRCGRFLSFAVAIVVSVVAIPHCLPHC